MSTHQAAALLAGAGIARTQAQLLLAAGLAGAGVRTAGTRLYNEAAVLALAALPKADLDELGAACPHGLVVARLNRARPSQPRPPGGPAPSWPRGCRPTDRSPGWPRWAVT
jgi:hypothetical protein